jgi:hypothetical protein
MQLAVLIALGSLAAACSDSPSGLTGPSFTTAVAGANFVVLANAGVTCTDGTVIGDVGTFSATGAITRTTCPITGTLHGGDAVATQAYNDFLNSYAVLAPRAGDVCTMLTGTLASVILAPGVYCFNAAATVTGVLTLDGPADGIWVVKIGTSGTGALTGTGFSVVMAGGGLASNVTWRVADAVTMTTSNIQGNILAGAGITLTGGSLHGNVSSQADVTITGTAVTGSATVSVLPVLPGALATITISPSSASLATGATQQFSAVGRDANNNIVPLSATWSVVNATAGAIDSSGLFTAGMTAGTYTNTVWAASGAIASTMTVTVTAVPVALASNFIVLANAGVTCTDGSIIGDVGTFSATGAITRTTCPITGTLHGGDAVATQAYNDFLNSYAVLAPRAGDVCTMLTGTLAGVILAPGVYCFNAAATVTGVVTLDGPADGIWVVKIGTSGTGALTGTGFSVVMAGGGLASNVTWRVADAVTMTTSNIQGNILAGAGITLTGGSLHGNVASKADVTITGTAVSK